MNAKLIKEFEPLWESENGPPDVFAFVSEHPDLNAADVVSVLLHDQRRRWQTDAPLMVEDYLGRLTDLASDPDCKLQLAIGEYRARENGETSPDINEFTSRFSDIRDSLRSALSRLASGTSGNEELLATHDSDPVAPDSAQLDELNESFEQAWQGGQATPRIESYLDKLPSQFHAAALPELIRIELWWRGKRGEQPNESEYQDRFPDRLELVQSAFVRATLSFISEAKLGDLQQGRYRIVRLLGEGAFGRVYLATDDELRRQVAIKVPTAERLQKPEYAELYLTEARTVAGLDHPNIVPVYDVGRTDDGSIYVISKFIEGCTLADLIRNDRPDAESSTQLMATVATALDHAHQRRLIHRDIKPANLLIEDRTGTAYVADFGLAIREEDYLNAGHIAGTPAYMSPEQARGEGHRLDGRSDIFSLGVVFYQLLTGERPFRGSTANELMHQVISAEPPPPRQIDETIPTELDRICMRSLAKRASDRYATAAELADDLLHWSQSPQQEHKELQITPKGLRSFDAEDADFFLDLLPGPRNRNGLPDSIQFWKTRIEETDSDKTFSVGLIYGPSGCGKSSLIKAGLLPRLSPDVIAVYLEATPDETETRILRGLRKQLPELPEDLGLIETFALLRRSEGRKVVVILDQFEQWLHAHRAEQDTKLVTALRQCDGGKLQAVVMVRDDFSMAASRFMRELETRILEGHNFATVDLFDVDHAQKVLTKFGQAFGKLPAQTGELTADQRKFVSAVASGLAVDGKVVSVRLALFAEMIKGKPWVPATLREVGGTKGIGVNFLEETFSSRTANPEHRLHQQAARDVLKALLPEVGSDIKGHMRSHAELLDASGYRDRPGEFSELLRMLDGELRLITPTDPEGFQTDSGSDPNAKFYQLTHDYLVPSLRQWLTQKQQETRKGRAEIRLAERSAMWNAKPENRHLPSLAEYVRIRVLTDKDRWSESQRKMIGIAGRVYVLRWGVAIATVLMIAVTTHQIASFVERRNLATQMKTATESLNTSRGKILPPLVNFEVFPREVLLDELQSQFADSETSRKLPLAYALAHFGDVRIDFLLSQVKASQPDELDNFVDALGRAKREALEAINATASSSAEPSEASLRQKARLAMVSLHLGDPSLATDMCQLRPDPIQRTVFVDECSTWSGDLVLLGEVASEIDGAPLRSALCLAVGSVPKEQVTTEQRDAWQILLTDWHQYQPDTGTHSASGWALRKWGLPLPESPDIERERTKEQQQQIINMTAAVDDIRRQVSEVEQELQYLRPGLRLNPVAVVTGDQASIDPAGNKVAFNAAFSEKERSVMLRNLKTSEERVLHEFAWDPMISPGTNKLVAMVSNEPTEDDREVLLIDPGDESVRSLGQGGYPTWSLNGETLFFQVYTSKTIMKVDVAEASSAPEALIGNIPSRYPAVSPDATKVAYFVSGEIRVLDIATRKIIAKHVTDGWRGGLPGWAPDSRYVGFGSYATGDERGLWILDIETGSCFMIVSGNATRPSWSQDGSRMLYEDRTKHEIRVVNWPREKLQQLAEAEIQRRQLQHQLSEAKRRLSESVFGYRQWRRSSVGLTLLRIPAGKVLDDKGDSDEVPEDFLLSDREISVGLFQQFIDDPDYPDTEKPKDWTGVSTQTSPTADHPVQQVSWYDAVLFCNWLSLKEGLTPCYERTGEKHKDYRGEKTEYNVRRLNTESVGYRLPNEEEWEYACRAGTTTAFSFGSSEEWIDSYGVSRASRAEPCGSKLPNGWGLFDLHGNVWEWCNDKYGNEGSDRVNRGGSWNYDAAYCRSASRYALDPTRRTSSYGFRVALSSPSGQSPEVEEDMGAEPVGEGTEGASAEQRP